MKINLTSCGSSIPNAPSAKRNSSRSLTFHVSRFTPHVSRNTEHGTRNTEHGARKTSHRCNASTLQRFNASTPHSAVALVITLILLSIITFMAITLLVVTRSEKGSVSTQADQTTATLAADAGNERAKMDLLAPMLALGNANYYDLKVPTNFINTVGFISSPPANANRFTNVSYNYPNGKPLVAGGPAYDLERNLENLMYDPRPPVYITNRTAANSNDFVYYLDLNRNGRFDASGFLPVIGLNGQPLTGPNNSILGDSFTGDPQWIGVPERPGFPHSATNKFISRWTYVAIPLSKTMDINYIHNYAKGLEPRMAVGTDSFFRNMGVGAWEINLAAFLADLNTNFWDNSLAPYVYSYNPPILNNNYLLRNTGTAFDDALSLLAYRYSPPNPINWANGLFSVRTLYGNNGVRAFASDFIDGYTHGPPMLGTSWQVAVDADPTRVNFGWSGSDNPTHFFAMDDLFDRAKTTVNYPVGSPLPSFAERLAAASARTNSYDRYTYYRMLAQLAADSAPEFGKLNLNYVNVDPAGNIVPNAETNFIPWTPIQFFTNAAIRLLANAGYSVGPSTGPFPWSPTNILVTDGVRTNLSIQIWPTNFYTPSVHRLLQLAANIYDATTNRTFAGSSNGFPSVFRPKFKTDKLQRVFIVNFDEVTNTAVPLTAPGMRDPAIAGDRAALNQAGSVDMVYGVPLIIGAKKGFPNFNELAMETAVSVTRKLQFISRESLPPNQLRTILTNQMYTISISNAFGVEAWNSYSNFAHNLKMIAVADMRAVVTNELGRVLNLPPTGVTNWISFVSQMNTPASGWPGWLRANHAAASFVLPFSPATNHFFFLTNSTYSQALGTFIPLTDAFEQSQNPSFSAPHWWLQLSTRLRFILFDTVANRIVDYVNLNSVDTPIDISYQLMAGAPCGGPTTYNTTPYNPGMFWCTNRDSATGPTFGVRAQIDASLGKITDLPFAPFANSQDDLYRAIDFFRSNFNGSMPLHGYTVDQTNNFAALPASRTLYITTSWQANDPLVHYTIGDLLAGATSGDTQNTNRIQTDENLAHRALLNLGQINNRYEPWGGIGSPQPNPARVMNLALKDPLVTRSDDWDFPTNKFPNVGWLGRIHRGTPWQTVYLKSPSIDLTNWVPWTGNSQPIVNFGQIDTNNLNLPVTTVWPATNWTYDALLTCPTNDWRILDLFSTAFNDNAARGRLGVNQTNLAAWSAIFSGVLALQADTNASIASLGTNFMPKIIQPAGPDGVNTGTNSAVWHLVSAINDVRATNFNGAFKRMGDILAVPELTVNSPLLGLNTMRTPANPLMAANDAVYERLPQQILGLVKLDQSPRFLIYSWGQALKPANRSIITSGPHFGLCTNYQVTAEAATRTLVRIDGVPNKPRIVVEKFNVLPPDTQ